jgi:hypothetical protein
MTTRSTDTARILYIGTLETDYARFARIAETGAA